MKRIRFYILLLSAWLLFFSAAGFWFPQLGLSGLSIILISTILVLSIIFPNQNRFSIWLNPISPILIIAACEAWTESQTGEYHVIQTLVEITAAVITYVLTQKVGSAVVEFENAVAKLTIGHAATAVSSIENDQGAIYREVRRARNHRRPLTLLTIDVSENSIKAVQDRMISEAQMAFMKKYTLSLVSNAMISELEDSNIVVQENDNFMILVPELKPEDAPILAKRLHQQVLDRVGVDVVIGTASLPMDGYTFDGLLYKAQREMEAQANPPEAFELDPVIHSRLV